MVSNASVPAGVTGGHRLCWEVSWGQVLVGVPEAPVPDPWSFWHRVVLGLKLLTRAVTPGLDRALALRGLRGVDPSGLDRLVDAGVSRLDQRGDDVLGGLAVLGGDLGDGLATAEPAHELSGLDAQGLDRDGQDTDAGPAGTVSLPGWRAGRAGRPAAGGLGGGDAGSADGQQPNRDDRHDEAFHLGWFSSSWGMSPRQRDARERPVKGRIGRDQGPAGDQNADMSDDDDACLLYTSDAADDLLCVDLGGRRI